MMTAKIRFAYVDWLSQQESSVSLTLVYNDTPISPDRIRRNLRDLYARVDRRLFGPRFHLRPWKMRSTFWAVTQSIDVYPHIHIGWKLPDGGADVLSYMLKHKNLWRRFAPHGDYELTRYRPGRWEGYTLRQLTDTNQDQLILSIDFIDIGD